MTPYSPYTICAQFDEEHQWMGLVMECGVVFSWQGGHKTEREALRAADRVRRDFEAVYEEDSRSLFESIGAFLRGERV